MTRKNKQWLSSCEICNGSITNNGSGRPRNVCSRNCKLERMRRVSKARYKPSLKAPSINTKKRDGSLILLEKLKRGACLMCNLAVTEHNAAEFDFDHRNRLDKTENVSKLKGRSRDVGPLLDEMAKCDLLCCMCHRRKTLSNRDFTKPATKVLQTTLF